MKLKKRWKRILLALIFIPILFIGSLLLYVQSNQSEIIKGELAKVNQEHKGLITVGDSQLSLFGNFPDLSIKLYDVQIFESKAVGAPLIMKVKDIYVGFNLWDMVGGNYDIHSLRVEDGVFNMVIHQDNTSNIENSLATTSEDGSATTNIHLNKIRLKNLDVHTLDEATNTDVEKFIYEAIGGFRVQDSIIAGHIDTELELNVIKDGDTTFIRKKHFEIHTDLVFNESTGILDISPSGIVMENGDFELEGSIDTQNDVNLDLAIKGTKPNFDMLIAFAPSDAIPFLEKYRNAGEIYFNATIKGPANKGNRPAINAEFGAGKAFLENTASAKKIDNMGFRGHFTNGANRDASTMEFSLTDMTASLEKGEFQGALFVKNFESPDVEMQIDANFNLDFIADFLELKQVQNASGNITLKMNFHDIVDINNPEMALQQLNRAYYAALKVENVHLEAKDLPVPLDTLNVDLVMNGKEATLKQFELFMGNSDVSISGFLSDLPSIVHHTDTPVEAHLDITSNYLDIAALTGFSAQDSTQTGFDEQLEHLSLGLSFVAAARDFTESEYLPKGEFFIDSLYAELKHYPHRLHDFHADVLIDEKDLKIVDFTGYIDDSDFHFDGLVHDYAFWMQPERNGDVTLDVNLTSKKVRLEDVFSYKGENYVPEEYRHEIFDDLALHFTAGLHYQDAALHSLDLALDKLDTKMKVHPQRFHDFKGNIHYEDEHLVVHDFHGEIGLTNFNVDLNYYLGDDPTIKKRDNYLGVRADYIDYDALFAFDLRPPRSKEAEGSTTEDVSEHADAFNIYELPFTDMRFKADIAHFLYHRLDLQNIKADVRTTPDHYIYIDTLTMDAAGGDIRLSGYFNGNDPKHIYMQPDLVMTNVDLEKVLFKFENFGQDHLVSDNLQGKLTARINGKIRVYPDLVPDLDQSSLEMDVKVLDGKLKNYDPMLALSDYMGDKNLRNIRFDTLQNRLAIDQGKISIPAMTIESTLGHMELSGTHDSDQNIDYHLRIPWKTVRKATWQKLFGSKKDSVVDSGQVDEIVGVDSEGKTKFLNLKISGTIDDYKVSLGKKRKSTR
ncbi:AsmA-like C-terminal region-containing protein [Flavobacteriaceae bacterium TP-CH-4]|uniref:AsmA-like C-terminal region-containing protein n=1 Tax=Pelagihabitans pacificus TaxID=2696054 RepID=A0A967AUU8_9FLAO|nr:AsmA-like C-terminal region-containing protein [Pelagihabitans pacificus]NHF60367.1 AsmA-like C-terminal region-containing protein [Pelagihabitans pacificus]